MDNYFIITGGPGSGKTTLIEALASRGHHRSVEAGRFIIQAQVAIGGNGVHWGDHRLFAELMLMHEVRSYEAARETNGPVFFDRGVPELVGYLPMMGSPVPAHFRRAAEQYRYNRRVFIAPPWLEIFANDKERKQDFAEAKQTYERCREAYVATGYELVDLPTSPVEERVAFVLAAIGA